MARMQPYKTLRAQAQDEVVIQKSRFIGWARPVAGEDEALAFLAMARETYRDASHHCYAYIIGENAGVMRYSDDGEPGGTAGLPMLSVLRAQGLVNCCAVVTRYFGGVLLGAGGLVRAYTQGCAAAVTAAGVVLMAPTRRVLCEVAYPLWDRLRYALQSAPCQTEHVDFAAQVTATLLVRLRDEEALLRLIVQVTDGQAETLAEDPFPFGWESEGTQGDPV